MTTQLNLNAQQETKRILYNFAEQIYQERYNKLFYQVRTALKTNPHNQFKGTAKQYIKLYGLDKKLWKQIEQEILADYL